MKKIVALFLIIVMLAVCACGKSNKVSKKDAENNKPVAVSSEHYSVNNAQFTYMVYSVYNNYYQTYLSNYGAAYFSYFGMDKSLPLSEQKAGDTTWLDICVEEAIQNLTQILALCEAAHAEGMTLSAENKEAVNNTVTAMEDMAKEYKYSFEQYVANLYGSKDISKKDIRGMIELQMLANQYSNEAYDKFASADENYYSSYTEKLVEELVKKYPVIVYKDVIAQIS